jgi:DNA-binding transcriptional LysR family regulator
MTEASPRFTLRQLEYFVTVADEGTMAGAANRHQISQSAISLAISDLERALAVQLFIRRKARGVTLSAAARQVLPESGACSRTPARCSPPLAASGSPSAGTWLSAATRP